MFSDYVRMATELPSDDSLLKQVDNKLSYLIELIATTREPMLETQPEQQLFVSFGDTLRLLPEPRLGQPTNGVDRRGHPFIHWPFEDLDIRQYQTRTYIRCGGQQFVIPEQISTPTLQLICQLIYHLHYVLSGGNPKQ